MNYAIILAAGNGARLKSKNNKMLVQVAGKPLVYYSIMALNDHPSIDEVLVVVNKENKAEIQKIVTDYHFSKITKLVIGGKTRQASLENGIKALKSPSKDDIIIVHNGANPLVDNDEISLAIEKTEESGACILGHFMKSTIKEVGDKHIIKTHDRDKLFAAETPQMARYDILKKALEHAKKNKLVTTDEAMLLEAIGQKVSILEAHEHNFKVTSPSDLQRLGSILGEVSEDVRVGMGQDSHVFEKVKKGLTLGGVFLKDEHKLEANSDGDVILHAVFNAISQATGDQSLGFYADPLCEKGVTDSKKYLEIALKNMKKKKLTLNSLGIMIECKTPKIDPLVPQLRKSLSQITGLNSRRIGITATSGEELTSFGRGLGIQCFAIVSLVK